MHRSTVTIKDRYAKLAETLIDGSEVTLGSKKKGFGSSALMINGKIFAMLSAKDEFVVKLPRLKVDELVSAGLGKRFDPGHGRLMQEWLVVESTRLNDWVALARDAMAFVAAKR